jgi:Mlc titration factor MtfA (ptsG expression regulator)
MVWMRDRRRRQLRATPLPTEWKSIVERNVPYYKCLPEEERAELEGLMQVFLAEKSFEGAGGLEMTDEIRVTIAAQACILLLGREPRFYPGLDAVIVYPQAYVASMPRRGPDGTVSDGPQARLGESWKQGALVVSWDDVIRGARDIHDGHNVVFHEFAHQLDAEYGPASGAPLLENRSMYAAWAHVLGGEYQELVERLHRHAPTFLTPYAATNPAEFFAVATESFFERSRAMRDGHPELYEQLRLFYHQDPAEWTCRLIPGDGSD